MQISSLLSSYGTTATAATTTTTTTVDTAVETSETLAVNQDTTSFSSSSVSSVISAHQSTGESLMDMSNDDFRDHLKDLVSAMESEGYDTSSFADIDSLSDSDLEALKSSMHEAGAGKGKNGPPPPPPKGYEMGAQMTADYSSTSSTDDITQILLDALEESTETDEEIVQVLLDAADEVETAQEEVAQTYSFAAYA